MQSARRSCDNRHGGSGKDAQGESSTTGPAAAGGALTYSYAVDTSAYAARPFFFLPQTADGPNADYDIMNTPGINFAAVLVPASRS